MQIIHLPAADVSVCVVISIARFSSTGESELPVGSEAVQWRLPSHPDRDTFE